MSSRAAWVHQFWRENSINPAFQALPASGFTVVGATPAPDAALLATGAELKLRNGISLRAKFESEYAPSVTTYAASAALRATL